jgi:hypothetical protein
MVDARGMFDDVVAGIAHMSIRWVKRVRVFMLVLRNGPSSDSLPSPFGQGAGVPLGCGKGEVGTGEKMAKVLNEGMPLSPSVRPDPLALADRDRREELRDQQTLTAAFFGDPLPGMSALDRQRRNNSAH